MQRRRGIGNGFGGSAAYFRDFHSGEIQRGDGSDGTAPSRPDRGGRTVTRPSPFRRRIIHLLIALLFFQGYPLLALQETETVRLADEPRIPWPGAPVALDFPWPDLEPPGIPADFAEQWRTALDSVLWNASILATSLGETTGDQADEPVSDPPSLTAGTPRIEAEISDEARKTATFDNALDEIPILPGWNMVSLPEIPPNTDPAAVLAPITGAYTKVIAADSCGDVPEEQRIYDSADPASATLTAIEPGVGLMIQGTTSTALPSDGELPATWSMPLCKGWNLIGLPIGQPRAVRNALASIEGKWERIFQYEADNPPEYWQYYQTDIPAWANQVDVLEPGRGFWLYVTADDAILEIKNEGGPPSVAFGLPEDLSVVTEPTEITGTVSGEILERWTLSYRSIGETEWIEIGSGVLPVTDGPLSTFDPTMLLNGLYELRLEASDYQNRQVEEVIAVSVEGNMKIGNFTLSFVDLAIPLSGLDIEVVRTYDSRQRHIQGDFGQGWTLDIRQGSYRNNRPPGDGWQFETGFLPCDSIFETKSHLTTIRLSDREIYRFRLRLSDGASTQGGCFSEAGFEFVDGPVPGATLEIVGNSSVFYDNGGDRLIDTEDLKLFEPDDVRLTTRDGRIFDLDLTEGVTRLEDPNSNEVQISPEGLVHSSGVGIDFTRDGNERITEIVDPQGAKILYTYDETGDLVTMRSRASEYSSFSYSEGHYLETYRNPNGAAGIRADYDGEGQLAGLTDAGGQRIALEHDLDAHREVVTDRLGRVQVMTYDPRGNVISHIDPLGEETRRTFDDHDRMESETDATGATTIFKYDVAGNQISIEDPLGSITRFTHDAAGRVLTETDPLGRMTTFRYDEDGNQISRTGPEGFSFTTTYDGAGNILTETGPTGITTAFTYDDNGNIFTATEKDGLQSIATYSANGNRLTQIQIVEAADGTTEERRTTFGYDNEGRLTGTVAPDGTTTGSAYDRAGNLVASTDPLGRVTGFRFDAMGRQTAIVFPDGTSELKRYDAEGQLIEVVDRAGRSTLYTYDAGGRITRITFADGTFEEMTHDAEGRVLTRRDARGFITTQRYDAAGRVVEVEDPLGAVTRFEYDAVGNRTAAVDANGHRTGFEYDGADRLIKVIHPDGSVRQIVYDAAGRQTAMTEPGGEVTRLDYDDRGRLAQITDPLGGITRYGYDALGNKTRITDALGRATRFEFDAMGRQTARILPDGNRESFAYDAVGNRTEWTTFSGQTLRFRYDDLNRLVEKTVPGAEPSNFTYTATGQLTTLSGDRGTTRYAWDDRDRLTSLTYPDGRELRYQWDATGNRTQMTAAFTGGLTMTVGYSYDAAGRLIGVSDPAGGAYSIGYDAAGNRTSLGFPNGVETAYAYDGANRLLSIHTTAGESALQSFDYELDANGNRTRITEADGTSRAFTYDAMSRLVGELVRDATGATVEERRFTYDSVSNRIQAELLAGEGSPASSSFTYDARDRIIGSDGRTYDWDADGNLQRLRGDEDLSLSWDPENRLTGIRQAVGGAVDYTYDASGTLMSLRTTDSGGDTEERRLLVDPTGAVSQVIAETNENGELLAFYVRGDDLLGIIRSDERRFVHADGLGSVRMLTDLDATATDRYTYEAFGELREHTGDDPNPFRFAGEMVDPNIGFYYLRARWMDPGAGRFLSMDPFPGVERDPTSLHKYLYASANPVNVVDPTGLFSVGNLAVTSAIIGGLSGAITGAITDGWVGAVTGLAAGLLLSPIFALLIAGAGYVIAVGAGISVAAGLGISSILATTIFGVLGVREFIKAETPREKTAAAVGLVIMVASLGVVAAKAPRRVTILGSRRDAGTMKDVPGFEVLDVPDEAWSHHLNRFWLQDGVDRGNVIMLKTNPQKFKAFLKDKGRRSILIDLELPMLEQQGFSQFWWFMVRWGV